MTTKPLDYILQILAKDMNLGELGSQEYYWLNPVALRIEKLRLDRVSPGAYLKSLPALMKLELAKVQYATTLLNTTIPYRIEVLSFLDHLHMLDLHLTNVEQNTLHTVPSHKGVYGPGKTLFSNVQDLVAHITREVPSDVFVVAEIEK